MDMDEMMENAEFSQDTDEYNMYPNPSGISTNDPVNDWENAAFFEVEEPLEADEWVCDCDECTHNFEKEII